MEEDSSLRVDLADKVFTRDNSKIRVVIVHRSHVTPSGNGVIMHPNAQTDNKVHEGVHKLHAVGPGGEDLAGLF